VNVQPTEILLIEDNPDDVELTLRPCGAATSRTTSRWLATEPWRSSISGRAAPARLRRAVSEARTAGPQASANRWAGGASASEVVRGDQADTSGRAHVLQEESDMVESYRLGVNSYVVKPVDFAKFTQSVSDLVSTGCSSTRCRDDRRTDAAARPPGRGLGRRRRTHPADAAGRRAVDRPASRRNRSRVPSLPGSTARRHHQRLDAPGFSGPLPWPSPTSRSRPSRAS